MSSLTYPYKDLELEVREFEISLMESCHQLNKELSFMYMQESEETEDKAGNKFVDGIKKIIDKICDFLQRGLESIGNFFSKDSGLTKDEFLNSKTGEITLDYDLERISQEVDKKILEGNKLVQLISKVGGVDDRVVNEYVQSCARAVDKNGKTIIKAAAAPIMYERSVRAFDNARANKGKDGLFKQCKSMKDQSQITKIINAMGNMAGKSMNMTEIFFKEYNKLSNK